MFLMNWFRWDSHTSPSHSSTMSSISRSDSYSILDDSSQIIDLNSTFSNWTIPANGRFPSQKKNQSDFSFSIDFSWYHGWTVKIIWAISLVKGWKFSPLSMNNLCSYPLKRIALFIQWFDRSSSWIFFPKWNLSWSTMVRLNSRKFLEDGFANFSRIVYRSNDCSRRLVKSYSEIFDRKRNDLRKNFLLLIEFFLPEIALVTTDLNSSINVFRWICLVFFTSIHLRSGQIKSEYNCGSYRYTSSTINKSSHVSKRYGRYFTHSLLRRVSFLLLVYSCNQSEMSSTFNSATYS